MFHIEPAVTQELTDKEVEILDANYKDADIPKLVEDNCEDLTDADESKLLKLLTEFKQLFDGTLGDWETSPARLELQQNHLSYHSRAYPIPKVHQDIFQKEIHILEELGVFKWEPESRWGSPLLWY